MKKISTLTVLAMLACTQAMAFCGFYVAKADKKLLNNASEVILVRDGDKTVITMSNDYQGDAKDFAMVVPVPVVLKKNDIKVANQAVFDKLETYSTPRLVEYYDDNPCSPRVMYESMAPMAAAMDKDEVKMVKKVVAKNNVTIEAQYTVGEYDILILSAKESTGLKDWLNENGYKIPAGAEEVLDPYIKSNLKFFVAKVNIKNQLKEGFQQLRPLQLTFNSPKFMLPIRLGMANSTGVQDLLIYAFTKKGRVECTNYRNVKIPTNLNMPLFIKEKFAKFYADLFTKAWHKQDENIVFTEYAWDISGSNYQHCDPCVGDIPDAQDLTQAGVWWINNNGSQSQKWGGSNYTEDAYFTRMHVRYDRQHFAQDLSFQNTEDQTNFQARYVLHHPATGDLNCPQAETYLKDLGKRRTEELTNLASYAGWQNTQPKYLLDILPKKYIKNKKQAGLFGIDMDSPSMPFYIIFLGINIVLVWYNIRKNKALANK